MTNITINGEEFEEVYGYATALNLAKLPDEYVVIKDNKFYKKVKKEEPKFPKVFESECGDKGKEINFLVEKDLIILRKGNEQEMSICNNCMKVLKEAIKYAEENQ